MLSSMMRRCETIDVMDRLDRPQLYCLSVNPFEHTIPRVMMCKACGRTGERSVRCPFQKEAEGSANLKMYLPPSQRIWIRLR
jgi:hypothetical protein